MSTLARRVLEAVAPHLAGPVYGLPGVHNLAFWREEGAGLPAVVVTRHEQTAVYAADGAARATGALGVALTTTGPGAANGVAAFGEAAAAGSPVLVVASEVATRYTGQPVLHAMPAAEPAQAALFAPLAKATYSPRTVDEAVEAVAAAVSTALTAPAGPVYLGIPTDLLALPAPPVDARRPGPARPDPAEVAAAARLLDRAERVVLWVGGGARWAGAEVRRLAERLGAPVVTTFAGRGALGARDPLVVGHPPHEPEVADLIGAADLLLVAGSGLDGMTTRNWAMPRPPVLVRIDAVGAERVGGWPVDAAVTGDAATALAALADAVSAPARPLPDLGALRGRVGARLAADPGSAPALDLLAAVEAVAGPGRPVVADMAVAGYWVGGYAELGRAGGLLYPIGWGTLGFALPAAVGVAGACGPTLVVTGDAGALYAVGDLATIAQERLPVVVLVVDDAGYGMLRYDQDRAGDPHRGVDLTPPDFVALAGAFGIPAVRVPDLGPALAGALEAAFAAGGPRLVTVPAALTPPRTTSPRWRD